MSTQTFIDYVSQLQAEPDRWLGLVTLYSVAETTVAHANLEALLTQNGLGKFVPKAPADSDVFRRTCSSAQRKRVATADAKVYVNIMLRDIGTDDEEVLKRIVIESVDPAGKKLGYSEFADVIFTKASGLVDVRRIGNFVCTAADEVAMEIVREYNRLRGTVDGACVRTVIGRVLDGSHATSLRQGGGCYFVSRDEAQVVAGLEAFASSIDGTMVHSVPLPNDVKQRENLVVAVEDEAKVEIERAIAEVADVLRKGEKVSGAALATFAGRYKSLTAKADRYATLLDTTLGSVRAALTVLDMQMAQLAGVKPARKAA